MGYRYDDLAPGEIYHLYTRGVEQRNLFLDNNDYQRFTALLLHCLPKEKITSYSMNERAGRTPYLTKEGAGLVDLLCYCLMTNHVHLLIRENVEGGTSLYMRRVLTSYACYFNRQQRRSGSLFVHPFKAVLINGDDQLMHVSRYIHLNPFVAHLSKNIFSYRWSSLQDYVEPRASKATCHQSVIKAIMAPNTYKEFVQKEADYAQSLADLKHLLVDIAI